MLTEKEIGGHIDKSWFAIVILIMLNRTFEPLCFFSWLRVPSYLIFSGGIREISYVYNPLSVMSLSCGDKVHKDFKHLLWVWNNPETQLRTGGYCQEFLDLIKPLCELRKVKKDTDADYFNKYDSINQYLLRYQTSSLTFTKVEERKRNILILN